MTWSDAIESAFRSPERARTMARIAALYRAEPELQTAGYRMSTCCQSGQALAAPLPSDAKVAPFRCDDRLCPCCNDHRHRYSRATLEECVEREAKAEIEQAEWHPARARTHYVRFLTLTMPRPDGGFEAGEGYAAISEAMLRLSRTQAWAHHVRGAFAGFEETWGEGGFHPHFHLLAVGRYWQSNCRGGWATGDCTRGPHQCLRCAWVQCGGGPVVDIRKADPSSIMEVTKYPLKVAELPDEQVVEWRLAMVRKRTCRTYGEWYGVQRRPPPDGVPRAVFRFIELEEAARGDVFACHRITNRLAAEWDEALPADVPGWATSTLRELRSQLDARRQSRAYRAGAAPVRGHTPLRERAARDGPAGGGCGRRSWTGGSVPKWLEGLGSGAPG